MKEINLISVIVPVYNVAEYLKEFIDSVLCQTYGNIELILVNDGSSDDSPNICADYANKDQRIHYITKTNNGVSSARNAGLKYAKGDYIGFADPDDVLDKDMYSLMMKAILNNNSDAVFCGYKEWHPENLKMSITHKPEVTGIVTGKEAEYQCIRGMNVSYFTSVWNKLFKRSSISDSDNNIHSFNENYSIAEDELWLAEVVPHLDKVCLLNNPLYNWRYRQNSAINNRFNKTRWLSAIQAKELSMNTLDDCKEAYQAKIYNDIYPAIGIAYYTDEKEMQEYFAEILTKYRKYFFNSKLYSKKKKFKYHLLETLITLRFPKKIIYRIMDTTYIKIKKFLNTKSSQNIK